MIGDLWFTNTLFTSAILFIYYGGNKYVQGMFNMPLKGLD